MSIQIIVIAVIVLMLGYIIFLHIELSKRNIFIESTIRKLSGIGKSRNMEEMMAFLREVQNSGYHKSIVPESPVIDEIINFILDKEKDNKIFIHYTKEERDAVNIINEGFRFADSFYKTALQVTKDRLDLITKHNRRKSFGDYLIVICISNDISNFYSLELEKAGLKNYSFENILTETPPVRNENSESIYQLAPPFIKGYINHQTGKSITNPRFDPLYNSPAFQRNLDLLKRK